jgi:hypothetical protein
MSLNTEAGMPKRLQVWPKSCRTFAMVTVG